MLAFREYPYISSFFIPLFLSNLSSIFTSFVGKLPAETQAYNFTNNYIYSFLHSQPKKEWNRNEKNIIIRFVETKLSKY